MKIGFSSLVCPNWDLETIITKASAMGFDGVELRGLKGRAHLPTVPELADAPESVRNRFRDNNLELVCLGSSVHLDSCFEPELAEEKRVAMEFIELAGKLGCPYVRIFAGEIQRMDNERFALSRVAEAVASLVPLAVQHNVTILVENGGDFAGSDALWFIVDAVGHPAVQVCWNQCNALTIRERPTVSLPRLGSRIGLLHVCDADFNEGGVLLEYRIPGRGQAEIRRQIELLKGLTFDRYLIFEWPKATVASLPEPDSVLPEVATFLRECLAAEQTVLTAYKADKRKPKLAARSAAPSNA